jgi:phenylalanyl-tRNA synthetase beta chain
MVDVPSDLPALTEQLDLTGTAVESVEIIGDRLDGIIIGQVIAKQQLPESDHLWVTKVDVGSYNLDPADNPLPLQIVCGAQNFSCGDKIVVALVGTTLPNGAQIKKTKLRGIESCGMNCSALELGIGEDHAGILVLDADAPVGKPFAEYLGVFDTVLDFEITPNRPDCMSVLGIAREVAAVFELDYQLPAVEGLGGEPAAIASVVEIATTASVVEIAATTSGIETAATASEVGPPTVDQLINVTIDDPLRCPRYTARLIKNVKVGPSPDWLVERIIAAGARPINNIVDVTNYIMFEVGQPMHAFDYDQLVKDADGCVSITIRAAQAGERFTTLDEVERELDPDITCIVDANAAAGKGQTVALAGVMGGLTSEVGSETVNVLLESAAFSPNHTSRTSRRLQLFSESSARFERGVDDWYCDDFSARAAFLIALTSGGQVVEGVVDCYPLPRELPVIDFRVRRFSEFVGAAIPLNYIMAILTRLGCDVKVISDQILRTKTPLEDTTQQPDILQVTTPSYRPDLQREIDLYEEVLRIWGMKQVEPTLPGGRERIGLLTVEQARERRIGELLRAMGINETMTYAFVPPADSDDVPMLFDESAQAVELIYPLSSEMSVLRRSILPGLLRSVAYNLNHGTADIKLYEMGTVFFTSEGRQQPKEKMLMTAVLVGAEHPNTWNLTSRNVDFYDAKGVIETIGRELKVAKLRFKELAASEAPWLQAGRAASVLAGSSVLGWLGEVHPRVTRSFGIEVPVIAFELEYPLMIKAAQAMRAYQEIPQFPAVSRDLAVVVDVDVTAEQLTQILKSAGGAMLASYHLFDVFEDVGKIGAGKKSLAFALSYQAPDRTLTSEEVDVIHNKVVSKLKGAIGAEIRA